MNRLTKGFLVLTLLAPATAAWGQMTPPPAERPQGGPQNGAGPGGDRPDGPPQDANHHDGLDHGDDHQSGPSRDNDRPNGRPGDNNRPPAPIPPEVQRFQSYLTMVTQYGKLASDPEATGVAAVVSAGDLLRKGGPQAAIDFFNKALPDVKFDAVRRAIRLQLVDLYKASGQQDKALEELKTLMTDSPTTDTTSSSSGSAPKK